MYRVADDWYIQIVTFILKAEAIQGSLAAQAVQRACNWVLQCHSNGQRIDIVCSRLSARNIGVHITFFGELPTPRSTVETVSANFLTTQANHRKDRSSSFAFETSAPFCSGSL